MPHAVRKNERFDFRMTDEQRSLFEMAAEISGQTLTSFLISNMTQISQTIVKNYKDIKNLQQTILSEKDSKKFIEILEENSEPNKALKSAYARYRKHKNK